MEATPGITPQTERQHDPGSPEGQHLIAHEVVHTLQQPDADISMMPKTQPDLEVDPDPDAEREGTFLLFRAR